MLKYSFYEHHPPTHRSFPKCHSVTIHILWMVHVVDGGWEVGGFMWWVGVWWDEWLEGS